MVAKTNFSEFESGTTTQLHPVLLLLILSNNNSSISSRRFNMPREVLRVSLAKALRFKEPFLVLPPKPKVTP